ncbi:hypothetical protein CDAR_91051 [Caerostris darwini]|uniref:Uncharacterized protein n=1 Tax=Caerostris darwini TaxID=1538125 RepID=A0AAV4QBY7_9ARAC|nr:hypothetical protein CDAR_91051 [Caerostris darwini]
MSEKLEVGAKGIRGNFPPLNDVRNYKRKTWKPVVVKFKRAESLFFTVNVSSAFTYNPTHRYKTCFDSVKFSNPNLPQCVRTAYGALDSSGKLLFFVVGKSDFFWTYVLLETKSLM